MNYTDHKVSDHFPDVRKMDRHVMNYSDNQLKAALAKMLPDDLYITLDGIELHWSNASEKCLREYRGWEVPDTQLSHLCWLVEDYGCDNVPFNASWQQRVVALAKVKGIEI
jgi:hypothetical protein